MTVIETLLSLEETVEKNKKLVYYVAKKFMKRAARVKIEFDDLVSEGMIGLIKAIQNFDITFGVKFATYAVPMIEGNIRRAIRDTNIGLKFSRSAKELSSKISGAETIEEIMEQHQVKRFYAEEALAYKNNAYVISLEQTVSHDDDKDLSIGDMVGYKEDLSELEVNDFLSSLPSKFKKVLELTMADKSQKEIGDLIGCSQVHVSRLMKKIRDLYLEYQEGGNGMATMKVDEFVQLHHVEGKTIDEIAKLKGTSRQTIYNWKSNRKERISQALEALNMPVPAEKKPSEAKSMPAEKNDKTVEYEQLILNLRNALNQSNDYVSHQNNLILELQTKIEKYEHLNAACEDIEEEVSSLRKENQELKKQLEELNSPALPLQCDCEVQVNHLQEENQAMRQLLKLWM